MAISAIATALENPARDCQLLLLTVAEKADPTV
jgi:hypothetical protein